MPRKPRTLVIGSAAMVSILEMKRVPSGGETVVEQKYINAPGGSGTNASIMLSRLGCDTIFCSCVGDDANGRMLTDIYRRTRIDSRFVVVNSRARTGIEVVMLTETESNRTIIYRGANDRLTAEDTESAMTSMPDMLFVQLSSPVEAVLTAVEIAGENGISVVVYAGHDAPNFPLDRLGRVHLFITDQAGVTGYTGATSFIPSAHLQVVMGLSNAVAADAYAVKLENGATLLYNNTFFYIETPPCDAEVVDPATAADTFAAAFACEFFMSDNLKRAAAFAEIIETMTLPGRGGALSIPKSADIPKFIADNAIDYKL